MSRCASCKQKKAREDRWLVLSAGARAVAAWPDRSRAELSRQMRPTASGPADAGFTVSGIIVKYFEIALGFVHCCRAAHAVSRFVFAIIRGLEAGRVAFGIVAAARSRNRYFGVHALSRETMY